MTLAGAVRDCRSGLSEAAEHDALVHAHSRGYDQSHYDAELAYCAEAMVLIQTMFPAGTPFPPVDPSLTLVRAYLYRVDGFERCIGRGVVYLAIALVLVALGLLVKHRRRSAERI